MTVVQGILKTYKTEVGILAVAFEGNRVTEIDFVDTDRPEEVDAFEVGYKDFLEDMGKIGYVANGQQFQLKVWITLSQIPYGETRTYGQIADEIGKPGAARAVGNACAANRLALVVPCHRVVGVNGIGEYRWGKTRKQELLDFEARTR